MTTATPPAHRTRIALTITAIVIAVLVILFFIASGIYTDVLWYDQLGFLSVLTTQWLAGGVMFVIGFLGMGIPVFLSIEIAFRARPVYARLNAQLDRYQQVVEPLRRVATFGIPILLGIFGGVSTASRWPVALQYLNRTSFGQTDPQFHLDISFYVYDLPFWRGVVGFASAVVILCAITSIATTYLYGAIRVSGREVRISKSARVQLAVVGAVYIALQAVSLWLDQYATLSTDATGVVTTGAGYTDVNAKIPALAILSGVAALVAILFIVTAVIGRWRLPIIGTALLLVSGLVIGSIYPFLVQSLQVEPSARSLEEPYIQRNIDATRTAYGVDDVNVVNYKAQTDVATGALKQDATTTANIRIMDPALISDTFKALQKNKQYYSFANDLDVDRYTIDGKVQDTVIAVRELDQAGLSSGSSTWYNDHLVYTHGFGVVAAYGNEQTSNGTPQFLESDIPPSGSLGTYEPRVYFGEDSPSYSIVGGAKSSEPIELDYPTSDSSDDSSTAKTTYTGEGGPKLDNAFTQLAYAIKFSSQEILLSNAVTQDSQILYDRDPADRVSKVAPYLTLDNDPYPAVVDGRIVWIVDGYTTTDAYPYSNTEQLDSAIADTYQPQPNFPVDSINYIRNSVKATVDAYDGHVTLYAWDTEDPLLKTWQKIYPSTLKPASDMSTQLLAHVRYPADLFKVQRAILGSYHVTDPNTFYSNEDQWVTPNDPISSTAAPTLQPPYYLSMKIPDATGKDTAESYALFSTYVPRASATSATSNLSGYLVVDSDAGPNYGKLTLLDTAQSANQVAGPGQVENNFNSNPNVTDYTKALNSSSNVKLKYGNLLTLPVANGFLYVQPLYVQNSGNTSYPTLQRVLVSFGGTQIGFASTLNAALDDLFGGDSGASAGDSNVPPTTSTPTATPTPTPTSTATSPPATGTPTDNAALQQALKDAGAALAAREEAYKNNDLVLAAQEDQKLQAALEKAISLGG